MKPCPGEENCEKVARWRDEAHEERRKAHQLREVIEKIIRRSSAALMCPLSEAGITFDDEDE